MHLARVFRASGVAVHLLVLRVWRWKVYSVSRLEELSTVLITPQECSLSTRLEIQRICHDNNPGAIPSMHCFPRGKWSFNIVKGQDPPIIEVDPKGDSLKSSNTMFPCLNEKFSQLRVRFFETPHGRRKDIAALYIEKEIASRQFNSQLNSLEIQHAVYP